MAAIAIAATTAIPTNNLIVLFADMDQPPLRHALPDEGDRRYLIDGHERINLPWGWEPLGVAGGSNPSAFFIELMVQLCVRRTSRSSIQCLRSRATQLRRRRRFGATGC